MFSHCSGAEADLRFATKQAKPQASQKGQEQLLKPQEQGFLRHYPLIFRFWPKGDSSLAEHSPQTASHPLVQ
jgi:hypothetical protein